MNLQDLRKAFCVGFAVLFTNCEERTDRVIYAIDQKIALTSASIQGEHLRVCGDDLGRQTSVVKNWAKDSTGEHFVMRVESNSNLLFLDIDASSLDQKNCVETLQSSPLGISGEVKISIESYLEHVVLAHPTPFVLQKLPISI